MDYVIHIAQGVIKNIVINRENRLGKVDFFPRCSESISGILEFDPPNSRKPQNDKGYEY